MKSPVINWRCFVVNGLYFATIGLAIGIIWIPFLSYYHVHTEDVTSDCLDVAIISPESTFFSETNKILFSWDFFRNRPEEQIYNASEILDGKIKIPGQTAYIVESPPNWESFFNKTAGSDLILDSFFVVRTCLGAFELTKNSRFLDSARDYLLAWQSYDKSTWFPKALLWNDHAAAERMLVLGAFWSQYRVHSNYNSLTAMRILQLVERHAAFLVNRRHYVFYSNHGVMQNIALLYFCNAFPSLAKKSNFQKIAFSRLTEQLSFYINDEGVILEHSPSYHIFGLRLLGYACYLLNELGYNIPDEWERRYKKGKEFYATSLRFDRTLPVFGDTENRGETWDPAIPVFIPRKLGDPISSWGDAVTTLARTKLYPAAGFAFLWSRAPGAQPEFAYRQTGLTWSHYPEHAHKHADELSLTLWGQGRPWWTNVGYWAYDVPGRDYAEGWLGANGPHFVDEPNDSRLTTRLVAYGHLNGFDFIDLERIGPGKFCARRQVVHVHPNHWLVVDFASGLPDQIAEVCWTAAYDLSVRSGAKPGEYLLDSDSPTASLQVFITGSRDVRVCRARGSKTPFLGWLFVDAVPQPTEVLVARWPADGSMIVTASALLETDAARDLMISPPSIAHSLSPEDWSLAIATQGGVIQVTRYKSNLCVTGHDSFPSSLTLPPPPESTKNKIAAAQTAFRNVKRQYYPRFKPLLHTRYRYTVFLFGVLLIQESFFFFIGKYKPALCVPCRISLTLVWLCGIGVIWQRLG